MQTVFIGSLLVIDIFFFNSKNKSRFYFVNWLFDIFHPFLKSQFIAGRFENYIIVIIKHFRAFLFLYLCGIISDNLLSKFFSFSFLPQIN